jgi:hypothetical protein
MLSVYFQVVVISCSRGWIQAVQYNDTKSSVLRPGSKLSVQVITTTIPSSWIRTPGCRHCGSALVRKGMKCLSPTTALHWPDWPMTLVRPSRRWSFRRKDERSEHTLPSFLMNCPFRVLFRTAIVLDNARKDGNSCQKNANIISFWPRVSTSVAIFEPHNSRYIQRILGNEFGHWRSWRQPKVSTSISQILPLKHQIVLDV